MAGSISSCTGFGGVRLLCAPLMVIAHVHAERMLEHAAVGIELIAAGPRASDRDHRSI
jgi:uncharacterized membrane protein YfcA